MKRNMVLVWVLLAALFLSACTQNDAVEKDPSAPPALIDRVIPTCKTLDEYNSFVANCDCLPDNFIHQNALEMFGEFRIFHYFVVGTEETGLYLCYTRTSVTDANDIGIVIKALYNVGEGFIRHKESLPFDETVADMRTHPSGESGTVYRDGINYIYSKGNLHQVVAIIDGLEIMFYVDGIDGSPHLYPVDGEDTPFMRLLSADLEVASSVVEELAAKLSQ